MKKPGRFNVVSVGDEAVWALPVVIEEELQMRCLRVQYAVDEQADEVVQLTLQVIVLPYPEQIGVQMGIHGLSLVGILVAEAHVGHFFPFAGQRFAISVFLSVEAVRLDVVKQTDGIFQCFAVARGTMVFAEPVDGKPDGIDLLLGV